MDLTRKSFPLGWTPSESPHGNSQGLLRMDNLHMEDNGCLTLVRGTQQIGGPFSSFVDQIYSKVINNTKARWIGIDASGKSVLRSKVGNFLDTVEIISNGGNRVNFGSALGQVFIASGSQRKKDDLVNVYNLGITTPTEAPLALSINQEKMGVVGGDWVLLEGENLVTGAQYVQADVAPDTFKWSLQSLYSEPRDLTKFPSGVSKDISQDICSFLIQANDPSLITQVSITFMLEAPDSDNNVGNSYTCNFDNVAEGFGQEQFRLGEDEQSKFKAKRSDFTRKGTNNDLGWTTVTGVKVAATCTGVTWILTSEHEFIGGPKGGLNGAYQWKQINVYNTGKYLAKSGAGPESLTSEVINGSVLVQPQTILDEQINEVWLYRRSSAVETVNQFPLGVLDKFYRVAVVTKDAASGTFPFIEDSMIDTDALELNIVLNEYTISVKDIHEEILMMSEELYFERMLYMTADLLYLSESLNPDAVDPRYTLKASGDPVEKNLWIRKLTNGVLLLGTTKDIYEVSGTLQDMPDGSLDAAIRPIAEDYPPISMDCCIDSGTIFYMAADGWRGTSGSNSTLISAQLNKLFQGYDRYGIEPVSIYPNNGGKYPCAVGKSKLFVSVPHADGTRSLFVLDLLSKTWRRQLLDPISLFVEEDDTILAGFGGGSGNYLRQIDVGDTLDNVNGQQVYFQTVFDDNNQPRNRKDTFTLKVRADTGNKPCKIYIARDDEDYARIISPGDLICDGPAINYFELSPITLGFRYSLLIIGEDLTTFKLFEFTIEYDPRPEQLNYLRIQNTNLGSSSRKRFINYAGVIDTLGNDVLFTPYVDNVAMTPSAQETDAKLTFLHYFTSETIGTDIGGTLTGGLFEFYGTNLEEIISEKLPTPTKYLVIPANDYGVPNRKRHSSYKFQIHTRGKNVKFTPILDGVSLAPLVFSTLNKRTVEYFFTVDTISIDIGGILESVADTPFEFYGTITPQNIDVLPPRLKEYRIAEDNFGIAAMKRVRTLPMVINTNGYDVAFQPYVDGSIAWADNFNGPTIFNTNSKQTVFHYFNNDAFGIDFHGELKGAHPFEFYGMLKPEEVEALPVAKVFDQIGPLRYDKIAKLYAFRIRMISEDVQLPFQIFTNDQPTVPYNPTAGAAFEGIIPCVEFTDTVYEVTIPKNVNGTIFRFTFGGAGNRPFHRYTLQVKINLSGMQSDAKWVEVK